MFFVRAWIVVFGGFAYSGYATADGNTYDAKGALTAYAFILGVWGLAELAYRQIRKNALEISLAESRQRQAQAAQVARRVKEKESAKSELELQIRRIREIPENAARVHAESLELLRIGDQWVQAAQGHQRVRAFTPFWESCENAYGVLLRHKASVDTLERLVRDHQAAMQYVAKNATKISSSVDSFTRDIQTVATTGGGESITRQLSDLVYAAQSDYEFASIYEQRRTTRAVTTGFSSMSAAVSHLGSSLSESYVDLRRSIDSIA